MNRRTLRLLPLGLTVAATVLAASAQIASADPSTPPGKGAEATVAPDQTPTGKIPAAVPMSALGGYQQVFSALLTDTAGAQTHGTVSCPSGTALVGGGAVISSSSLQENLNASVPSTDGLTWSVYVNNASSTNGTFRVYAECVRKVAKYQVVVGTGVTNNAGTQTSASVSCPTGTFPYGGGGFASSGSTLVNLNTSVPLAKGWRTDVNNGSTGSNTATAYVVCGKKPAGYAQVIGTGTTINANSQGNASVACPTGRLVLSGGAFSSSGSTAVNLNSTIPSGTSAWVSYENNATTATTTLTSYAVCATASS